MAKVHPTASVSPECELASSVEIGPHCVLTGRVVAHDGVRLIGSTYVQGPTTIGEGTLVYPFACIGFEPQDFKFAPGSDTAGVVIGKNCIIREHATIHASTRTDRPTRAGDRVFLMVGSHLGHDVQVGNNVVMVNGAGCAGHAEIGDGALLSGQTGVHQFTRVGRLAMLSGGTAVSMDVPPFCMVPERNRLGALNLVGMRRAGIPRDQITETRRAFRDVFRPALPRDEMLAILRERGRDCPPVMELAEFVASAKRPICPGAGRPPRLFTTFLSYSKRGRANLDAILAGADEDDAA